MLTLTITPRFYETDAFGHINNTVISGWFESAREPIFRIFSPNLDIDQMSLILARVEIDFVAQTHYGQPVNIRTGIERIGRASFVVAQEVWQHGICTARGKAVQVYFDFKTQQSDALPEHIRQQLAALPPLTQS